VANNLGYAAEFGLTAAKGMAHLLPLLRIRSDESLSGCSRALRHPGEEYIQLQAQIDDVMPSSCLHRADECSGRLTKDPRYRSDRSVLLKMKTPEPTAFKTGRQFAA